MVRTVRPLTSTSYGGPIGVYLRLRSRHKHITILIAAIKFAIFSFSVIVECNSLELNPSRLVLPSSLASDSGDDVDGDHIIFHNEWYAED